MSGAAFPGGRLQSRDRWNLEFLLLLAAVAAFAVAWLWVLNYTSLVAPVDNIEQLVWVRSLEWGYHKHPPLPTWLMWLPAHLFGVQKWTSYLTGAAVTLSGIGLLYLLLVDMRGRRHAAVAVLGVLCITYYNDRLYYYNHNVVLMACVSAAALLCWKACESGSVRD